MSINETATGNDSVAITGTASAGERTVGVKGVGDSVGVQGRGKGWHGVEGISDSTIGGFGVFGAHTAGGTGVVGESTGWIAVGGFASSESQGPAVYGEHKGGQAGVRGESTGSAGVHGRGPTGGFFEGGSTAGVHAVNLGEGPAILAKGGSGSRNLAGFFDGNVEVTQSVKTFDVIILGSDCAEDFDIAPSANTEAGTVMVIGDDARLVESHQAYDKRVAGIISGAGDYKPGIVLGRDTVRKERVPLALIGKVFCKVDASYAPVEVGDLLTTSPTQGHAMKANDPFRAFGAVVGKALAPLKEGQSLLPILVALQ